MYVLIQIYIVLAFPGQSALNLYTLRGSSLSYKPRSAYHDMYMLWYIDLT